MFHVYCRRPHPYGGLKKFSSVRPLNSKLQAGTPAAEKVTVDSDIENKSIVNKVECNGRKQDLPVLRKASVTNVDHNSKWSKFLSNDIMIDGSVTSSQLVSDCLDEDSLPVLSGCSTTDMSPSTVSTVSLPQNLQHAIKQGWRI